MEEEVVSVNDNDVESSDSNEPNESETAAENNISTSESVEPSENVNTNEDNQSSISQSHDFDLNLPASHSYLGSNLEELRGRTILDEGIYVDLPLLVKRSTVLFPGQTLPMAVFEPYVQDMLSKCIQKDKTFGVVSFQEDKLEDIGTTAEIYEYMQGSTQEGLRIKAKGRQRFKILKKKHGYYEISATVKIIPEISLPHPFSDQKLSSLDTQRIRPTNEYEQKKQNKVEMFDSTITHWPAWVYRQYNPYRLAFKIHQQLQFIEIRGSSIPTDPADLSYWVAQNLPLNDNERIMLLKYDCAIPRLQWELKYLMKDRILVCRNCVSECRISKQSDIFPMSKEGPQSTFCNSGGFIHDTITLYQAENLRLSSDPPSAECSWFPGYAWTIATCKGCGMHMGWLFTADEDKTLRPSSFWGLTRRSLKSKLPTKSAKNINYSRDEYNQSDSDIENENSTEEN